MLAAACARTSRTTTGPPAPSAAGLLAGAAASIITPDITQASRPVYVGGLERGLKSTGVHDDLYARALVMTDASGTSVGLVILDLIGFFHDDVEEVRRELSRRHPDVKLDYLAVASTHTHAGPDVIGLWTPIGESVDADYLALVRSRAVDAVAKAWGSRQPARMSVAQGEAPGLAKDTRLPEVIDETVLAMGLTARDGGQGIASLVNWNSHPSVSGGENSMMSADFPRGVIRKMEAEWGGTALYASGALGGQIGSGRVRVSDPQAGDDGGDRMKRAEMIGDRIARIALGALTAGASAKPPAEPVFRVRAKTIMVPMDNARFAEGLAIGLIHQRRLYPNGAEGSGLLPSELPDRSALRPGAFSLRSEVGLVDLGPARWALIPGELYPELSLGRFQDPQDPGADYQGALREPPLRPTPGSPLFLIGLANDELGYIIPKSQWDSEPPYAYGRDEPQYGERNSTGPETAPVVMQALMELLTPSVGSRR